MVIDTSAIVAILSQEPEALAFATAIEADPVRLISAAAWLESSIAIGARYGDAGLRELDLLVARGRIGIEPVTVEQAEIARQCFQDHGKGRHAAGMNFGDCFSYALSMATGEPLLAKGADFGKTDVALARTPGGDA